MLKAFMAAVDAPSFERIRLQRNPSTGMLQPLQLHWMRAKLESLKLTQLTLF
jgi:hypothetical protein